MSPVVLKKYLENKYLSTNVYTTISYYEKIITQYDSNTQTTTVNRVRIDEDIYNGLPVTQTTTYTLPTGPVTITTERNAVSIYDYELALNESKRNIKILNSNYVSEVENQLKKLMA
jgi:glucose-6-phosphate 1-dehydrogenase